jgi:hypothetical protein
MSIDYQSNKPVLHPPVESRQFTFWVFTGNVHTYSLKFSLAPSDVKLRLAMEEYTEDFHNTSRCHSSPAVLAQTLHETTKATRLQLT